MATPTRLGVLLQRRRPPPTPGSVVSAPETPAGAPPASAMRPSASAVRSALADEEEHDSGNDGEEYDAPGDGGLTIP